MGAIRELCDIIKWLYTKLDDKKHESSYFLIIITVIIASNVTYASVMVSKRRVTAIELPLYITYECNTSCTDCTEGLNSYIHPLKEPQSLKIVPKRERSLTRGSEHKEHADKVRRFNFTAAIDFCIYAHICT